MPQISIVAPDTASISPPVDPSGYWTDTPPTDSTARATNLGLAPSLQRTVGDGVAWHTAHAMFQTLRTTGQSIPNSTWTSIAPDTDLIDNYGGDNDTTNTTRYTPLVTNCTTDYYLITGYIPWTMSSTSSVAIAGAAMTNGTTMEGAKLPGGPHNVTCFFADIVTANPGANDYFEFRGYQNSGVSVNTTVAGKTPNWTIRWIGGTGTFQTIPAGQPITPHTWIDQDQVAADATGASPVSPGVKVPLNREVRDVVRYLNNVPIARLTSVGSTQSITNTGVYQSVQMPTNSIDNYTGWSAGTNTRYTAQRAGLYLVIGYVSVTESSGTHTGYRACQLLQTLAAGGTTTYAGTSTVPDTSTNQIGTAIHAIAMVRMAVNDYVELQAAQTQSNAPTSLLVNNSTGNSSKLLVIWLSQ